MCNDALNRLESVKEQLAKLMAEQESAKQEIESGLKEKAVVFVDMVGSTQFKKDNESDPSKWILRVCQFSKIVASTMSGCNGVVVKYIGDEVMGTFDNVNDAANFVRRISQIENDLKTVTGIETRIKTTVDYGPVYMINFDGHVSPDPQGLAVDRCARIAKYNQAGCVLTSSYFKDEVNDLVWKRIGKTNLKGIGEELIYQLKEQTIDIKETIEIPKEELDQIKRERDSYKLALSQVQSNPNIKVSIDEEDDDPVEVLISEINKLIDDADVDSDYYARFLFLYVANKGVETYNSFEGKVFDGLIEKNLVSSWEDSDKYYVLNVDNKRNKMLLKTLDKLQQNLECVEENDELYELSIEDADFWKERIVIVLFIDCRNQIL